MNLLPLSHAVEAGGRLAVNSSPEPFSNVAASLAEDGIVLVVVLLAFLLRFVRRGWRRWKGRDPDTGARPARRT